MKFSDEEPYIIMLKICGCAHYDSNFTGDFFHLV